MIKDVYYIFFTIALFFVVKKRTEFIFFLPIFNVIADTSYAYFIGFSLPTILRALVLTIFLLFSYPHFKIKSIAIPFYVFFIYVGIMTCLSEEIAYSVKGVYQVLLSMSLFMVGYGIIINLNRYERLLRSLTWIVIFSVVVTLMGYLFGIGKELEYTARDSFGNDEDNVGLLGSGGLYTPGVILALTPILFRLNLKIVYKRVLYFSLFLLYVLILLNVRRTAILIPVIGSLGFLFYASYRRKVLTYASVLVVLMLISFPFYAGYLIKRFEIREAQGRFEEDFYKTEQRYIENIKMFEDISQFKEPAKIIFGLGNNIFAEHVQNGVIVRRMFHSDSAKLFYGVGLFGMMLYITIYIRLFYEISKIPVTRKILIELKAAALGLIFIQIFVSLNGSLNLITFRSVTFLLLGAVLGLSNKIVNLKGYPSSLIKNNLKQNLAAKYSNSNE